MNPSQVVKALKDLKGVVVYQCELDKSFPEEMDDVKWAGQGISSLQSFEVQTVTSVKTWQAYQVGTGKVVKLEEVHTNDIPKIKVIKSCGNPTFSDVKARKATSTGESGEPVFHCPDDACVKVCKTYDELEHHLDTEGHEFKLEQHTLFDRAKVRYAQELQEGQASIENTGGVGTLQTLTEESVSPEQMGYALPSRKKRGKNLNKKQKDFLRKEFDKGLTGPKAKPETVSSYMRKAVDPTGQPLFEKHEFLTAQRIGNWFSAEARKRKKISEEDYEAIQQQKLLERIRDDMVGENTPGDDD